MADIKYEIIRRIKVLSEKNNGWTKEINIVSWNDREGKMDIRDWNHEEGKMGKGVTLTKEEAAALLEALREEL